MGTEFEAPYVPFNVRAVFSQVYQEVFEYHPLVSDSTSEQAAWEGLQVEDVGATSEVVKAFTEEQYRRCLRNVFTEWVARAYVRMARKLTEQARKDVAAMFEEVCGRDSCTVFDPVNACVRGHDCSQGHSEQEQAAVGGAIKLSGEQLRRILEEIVAKRPGGV